MVQENRRNFMGTGKQISAQVQQSSYLKSYVFSYLDPYFTENGISLGYNLSYTLLNQGQAGLASYLYNTKAFSTYIGIPISETDTINVGLGLSSNYINVFPSSAPPSRSPEASPAIKASRGPSPGSARAASTRTALSAPAGAGWP